MGRCALGPVDYQEARGFIEFIFNLVPRRHFDKSLHQVLRSTLGPGFQAVPGVSAPAVEIIIFIHISSILLKS